MRTHLLLLTFIYVFSGALAQEKEKDRALPEISEYSVGVQFGTLQYVGEFADELFRTEKLHGAFGLSCTYTFTKSWDFFGQLTHGIIDYYQFETAEDSLNWNFRTSIFNLDLGMRFKLNNGVFLKEESPLMPFLYLGLGDALSFAEHYQNDSYMDFNIPIGWGILYQATPRLRVGIMSTFHYTFSDFYDGWDRTQEGKGENLMDRFMFTGVSAAYTFEKTKK